MCIVRTRTSEQTKCSTKRVRSQLPEWISGDALEQLLHFEGDLQHQAHLWVIQVVADDGGDAFHAVEQRVAVQEEGFGGAAEVA